MKRAKIVKELSRLNDIMERQPDNTIYRFDAEQGAAYKSGYKEALRDLLITVSKGEIRNFLDVSDQ